MPQVSLLTPRRVLLAMSAIQEKMSAMNVWTEGIPDGEAYASWDSFHMQMYSFQFALCAMEGQIRQSATLGREVAQGAAESIASSLQALADTVRGTPQGDEFADAATAALTAEG